MARDKHKSIAERLRIAINETGLTQSSFARRIGRNRRSIAWWLEGKFIPDRDSLQRISQVTGRPVEWFLGVENAAAPVAFRDAEMEDRDFDPGNHAIPVLGEVRATDGVHYSDTTQNDREWFLADAARAKNVDFMLRVRGTSLVGMGILPGDLLGIRRVTELPPDNSIVVAELDDGAVVKRLFTRTTGHARPRTLVVLESADPSTPPIIRPAGEVVIRGRAVWLHREFA